MIIYCGLRHFYVHHFESPQTNAYYILTHNGEIWDFSPELKQYGVTNQIKPKAVFHLEKPVLTVPIALADFQPFSQSWHEFSKQYTAELEPEYPHAWYLRFQQESILKQFMEDFQTKAKLELEGSICGAGFSKLVAKLAAHNLPQGNELIKPQQTEYFLRQIPLHRLPLPETASLEKLGIKTVGELAEIPLVELMSQFGQRAPILQKLGRGEDLNPFQTQQVTELAWELDCTTLEGFLRPLTLDELQPYLKHGLEELITTLRSHNKIATLLKLGVKTAPEGDSAETQRRFKVPTCDFQVLSRTVDSLIPRKPLEWLKITLSELQPAPTTQLNMFAEPLILQLEEELPAQRGVELPRRERLLLLWEEYFGYEQVN